MGILDAPLRNAASTLLRTFGQTNYLREVIKGEFQPALDRTDNTPVDYPVQMLLAQVTAKEARGPRKMGDWRVFFAAADLVKEVDTSWQLVIAGQVLEIVEVIPYIATDQTALVELYARGKRV